MTLPEQFDAIVKTFTPQELVHKQEFLDYWTEKSPNGTRERWQFEKTFDVNLRFRKWLNNHKTNFGRVKVTPTPPQSKPDVVGEWIEEQEQIQANEQLTKEFHETIEPIKEDLSFYSYPTWIEPIIVIDVNGSGEFTLHHEQWRWVKEHYQELLEKYAGCKVHWWKEKK